MAELAGRDRDLAALRTFTEAVLALPGEDRCREALRRTANDDREGGVLSAISAQSLLCLDGFLTGGWDQARQLAEECIRSCHSQGYPARALLAREQLAMIAAARGDSQLVRETTGDMLRWAMPHRITLAQMAVHRVHTLAALGRGDFEEAYRAAVAISPPGILASHVPHALWTGMDLVEASVRTGRPREAAAHVAAMRAARIAAISPRLALLVTGSAALAAPAGQTSELFEQALSARGADRWPFEFARVRLGFGEHLRRIQAIADARAHLGAASAAFRALGARPWADRAADELRATRLTLTRREYDQTPSLTAQERRIVSLAAAGLTNKQIGQRLYLSPRTVSSHLYRVFPKLGVSSRAGLRDALIALASGEGQFLLLASWQEERTWLKHGSPSLACCAGCAAMSS
jgi:DNA-binding CsgD family transcriptional regulator